MGIFSPRNFSAPFTNTVNLIAIIFVVLLFAVFRFSTGRYQAVPSISDIKRGLTSSDSRQAQNTEVSPSENEKSSVKQPLRVAEAAPTQKAESAPARQVENPSANDIDKEIAALSAEAKQSASPKKAEAQNGSRDEGKLQDIEKALGIK